MVQSSRRCIGREGFVTIIFWRLRAVGVVRQTEMISNHAMKRRDILYVAYRRRERTGARGRRRMGRKGADGLNDFASAARRQFAHYGNRPLIRLITLPRH